MVKLTHHSETREHQSSPVITEAAVSSTAKEGFFKHLRTFHHFSNVDKMTLDAKITTIQVECYASYKAEERPVSFILDGIKHVVEKIIDQWHSPEFEYFKVLADDGKGYILRNDLQKAEWILERVFNL